MRSRSIFVTGGTGYMGSRLVPLLVKRRHRVTCVVQPGAERRLSAPCSLVQGDALNGATYHQHLRAGDTFVHLVGVAHPSPAKAKQFEEIDLRSAIEAIRVATDGAAAHFVYFSVAHPSPVMKAYIDARTRCESELLKSGVPATILRPFYVLGPGHHWPYALMPFYWAAERLPSFAEGARRLGLVTIAQMIQALTYAIENPPPVCEILDVPAIRRKS